MEPWKYKFSSTDQMSIVIICGNGQQDVDPIFHRVHQALFEAKIESNLLVANKVWSEAATGQICLQITRTTERSLKEFSVVVPILNEKDNLQELHRRLTAVLQELGKPYEVIYVDDGSQDGSIELLREMHLSDPCVCVISLTRNFGHQQAVSAGLDQARGRAVIVMDADLQDPPEVIPHFIDTWRKGFQVVYAIREKRKENIIKRIAYRSFYILLRFISRVDIPLEAGDFCLMDRCVVDVLTSLPERNRFVRGLRSWIGFRQIGLSYIRGTRFEGKSKYTFRKLVGLALDGLISFSDLPLRMSTLLGFTVSIFSFLAALYYFIRKQTVGLQPPGFATLTVLLLFLGGVQLISIGVVGEYVGHVLHEVKRRPSYVIREVMGSNLVSTSEEIPDARTAHSNPE